MGMLKVDPKPKVVCGETRTKQSEMDKCDINKIMNRYRKTGRLPELIKKNPTYGDFSKPVDYQSAMNVVIKADESFAALPSRVRKYFDNDPVKMLAFVDNPDNEKYLVELGLKEQDPNDPSVPQRPKVDPKKDELPPKELVNEVPKNE